jgi:8-oxo-dGTP diphosphatase
MEVVGAIIRNQRDEYLLQQRDEKAPSFKHCWTFFGGRIEAGEQPEQALLRELKEELRLDPGHILSLELSQTNHDPNGTIQYIYLITTDVLLDKLTLQEGEAMAYIPEPVLFDREFAFNIKDVLERYIKKS